MLNASGGLRRICLLVLLADGLVRGCGNGTAGFRHKQERGGNGGVIWNALFIRAGLAIDDLRRSAPVQAKRVVWVRCVTTLKDFGQKIRHLLETHRIRASQNQVTRPALLQVVGDECARQFSRTFQTLLGVGNVPDAAPIQPRPTGHGKPYIPGQSLVGGEHIGVAANARYSCSRRVGDIRRPFAASKANGGTEKLLARRLRGKRSCAGGDDRAVGDAQADDLPALHPIFGRICVSKEAAVDATERAPRLRPCLDALGVADKIIADTLDMCSGNDRRRLGSRQIHIQKRNPGNRIPLIDDSRRDRHRDKGRSGQRLWAATQSGEREQGKQDGETFHGFVIQPAHGKWQKRSKSKIDNAPQGVYNPAYPPMRLKRLTLHGFKTFADKTEILFAPGITAVVGPNGSGKSNIADAVLWVLGEQKTSSLRAAKAQDVIFAGSTKRKATGVAEVTLTLDNEDGTLPVKFAEVTVTRRIYRSGEGEYFLNRVPCRLKDITDLFLDTGVGRDAYAIVNQAQVDAVLSARPEERRELFEEAAGIKRYRARRRETQRKLENTEANLHRVRDIASELERQREPMAMQAENATRHNELTTTLRQIEVAQLAQEWRRLSEEQAVQQEAAAVLAREIAECQVKESKGESRAAEMSNSLRHLESDLEQVRHTAQALQMEHDRAQNALLLSRERQKSAGREAETLQADLLRLQSDLQRMQTEAQANKRTAETLRVDAEARQQDRHTAEEGAKRVENELRLLTQRIIGQEADDRAEQRRRDALQAERDAIQKRQTQRQREVDAARTRIGEANTAAQTAQLSVRESAESLLQAEETFQADQKRHTVSLEPSRTAQSHLLEMAEQRTKQERDLAGDAARLRALEETEAAREGYFQGVRSVLRGVDQNKLPPVYRTVADSLAVPAYLDMAVETALGGGLQDFITPKESDAKAAIAFLNESRGGRATFLPLDALRSADVPESLRRAAKEWEGVLGVGSDLVGHDPAVALAVRVLLARVLFVETLEAATTVSRKLSGGWSKIVTLTGEVVVPSGAVTGGTQARQSANLLGRKREIGELFDTVQKRQDNLSTLKAKEAKAGESARMAEIEVRDALTAASQSRDALNIAQRNAQTNQAEAERRVRHAELMRERFETLANAAGGDAERITQIQTALDSTPTASVPATKTDLLGEQRDLSARRDAAQKQLRVVESEIALLRERYANTLRDSERADQNAKRTQEGIIERKRQMERTVLAAQGEADSEQQQQATVESTAKRLAHTRSETESIQTKRGELQAEIGAAAIRQREVRQLLQQKQDALHGLRLRLARWDGQIEAVRERLWSYYELTVANALQRTGDIRVEKETTQEINKLRRSLKDIGEVNPLAVEEFAKLTERLTFLSEQQSDLQEAREQLLSTIGELDEETKDVFLQTFRTVGTIFARIFQRLFGGGETELILTDPGNLLETGIEIVAQPPGKKRQSLALLSGGERALTATALLFAFLEVRPAPFCILDEVDAPLDGANIEKFSDMLRDVAQKMQFIVITHNASTMEAAPLWYGVTMQEPGVSRGLSMKAPKTTDTIRETEGMEWEPTDSGVR